MTDSAFTERQQQIINLLKSHADAHDNACTTLDSKAQDIINLGGVLFVIFGGLNITQISGTKLTVIELVFSTVAIVVCYLFSLFFSLYARRPIERGIVPLKPTSDNIENWLNAPDFFSLFAKSYQEIISKTLEVENHKAKWVRVSLANLVLMIVFMIGTIFLAIM